MNEKSMMNVAVVPYLFQEGLTETQHLEKVKKYVIDAKKQGANLIVFPELTTTELVTNWNEDVSKQIYEIAINFAPKYQDWLKQLAVDYNVNILGGTTPRLTDSGVVNTAFFVFDTGKIIVQDKLFLTPSEIKWKMIPGHCLNVFDSPWGVIAILICFDSEFPAVSQILSEYQVDLILVPSWTSNQYGFNRVDSCSKARAIEHCCIVIKTGTIPDVNFTQEHAGNASIIYPQDLTYLKKNSETVVNQNQILLQELNFKMLSELKYSTGYYPARIQNEMQKAIAIQRI